MNRAKETPSAEATSLRPALRKDRNAAEYLGVSVSWIRAARAADTKALREGRPPPGPAWIVIGKSVFYRSQDLDDWIARNAVERGCVEFANRGGGRRGEDGSGDRAMDLMNDKEK